MQQTNPEISIIIPVVNEARNLSILIPYLRKAGGPCVKEIIVVDACSKDGSHDVSIREGAAVLHSHKENRAVQMNLGAAHASAEILYFLHADTIPPQSFSSDIIHSISEGYHLGCFRFRFDSSKWYLKINSYFTRIDRLWCRGGDQSLFIPKSIFSDLGGFNTSMAIMEEYDFIIRARQKYRFRIIPKNITVSARKYHQNSYFRVQWANFTAFRMYQKGYDTHIIKEKYYSLLKNVR